MRALVAGWFSFEGMGATAGDLLARDVVSGWLAEAGFPADIAVAPPFDGGVDWRTVEPHAYSHVVFVCGPFGNGWPLTEFLPRFSDSRLVGVDLSLLEPLEAWDPFDLLLERDSSRASHPDLALLSAAPLVPLAGIVLVHRQTEYEGGLHDRADAMLRGVVERRDVASVDIDTRLDENGAGLRTAAQVESLIARMDVVLTTRLHGLVLALKNGVPAVAVDPIAGGAKVRRQAEKLGWHHVFTADDVTEAAIRDAFEQCLTPAARVEARRCADRGRDLLGETRSRFMAEFGT